MPRVIRCYWRFFRVATRVTTCITSVTRVATCTTTRATTCTTRGIHPQKRKGCNDIHITKTTC